MCDEDRWTLERFRARTTRPPFELSTVMKLLQGEIAACHLQGMFDGETGARIGENFWNNPGLRMRSDRVPAWYLGAYHYSKTTEAYLADCASTRPQIEALFAGVGNPVDDLWSLLARAAEATGRTLRLAEKNGMQAARCAASSWCASGPYMLAPHDDVAQMRTEAQRGFEIQEVRRYPIVGVNLYVTMPSAGGELQMWNARPNDACRRKLGVQEVGHPYRFESLNSHSSQVISVRPGDCVLLNGAFIHAVRGVPLQLAADPKERRVILTLFVGIKDNSTILWWT